MIEVEINGANAVVTLNNAAGILYLPDGMTARLLDGEPDDWREGDMSVPQETTLVFRPKAKCPAVSYGYVGEEKIKFIVSRYDNSIILEDYCFGDSFKAAGTTEDFEVFIESVSGAYVYDDLIASFRLATDEETADPTIQKYAVNTIPDVPLQTNSCDIDAYFDTSDIVFADYAVGDNQVDTWLNANVSVAGLYMTYIESTDTEFKKEVSRIQLSGRDKEGKYYDGRWGNKVFCGRRIIESKQMTPDSYDTKAIKYRFRADFTNNGKDDIEVQSLNILSTLKIFEKEGGENA